MKKMKTKSSALEILFSVYDAVNPEIYKLFTTFSLTMLNLGHTKLSANLIFERMRWESALVGNGMKINNSFRPYYARKFMEDFPQYNGTFSTRVVASEL